MSAVFKPDETFRGDFTFRNSLEAIRRFPLPFPEDNYMYSVNIEPHTPGPKGAVTEFAIDVDEHYVAECKERALVLAQEPLRYQALPHMLSSQWDCLELIMESLSRDYPQHFSLERNGNRWHWINRPLGLDQHFTFGDASTLPYEPLEYATRQAQGDWVVMDQRDGNLWAEAGMVTTQADWSLDFDVGMTFQEWHGPVPLAHELGVFDRALKYLLNLRLGSPVRRLNWTMTVHPRLDTSPENYPKWGQDRASVTAQNAGDLVHLRVELQALWRLPRSNAIVFSIRCYLISVRELATVPKWARRVRRVLEGLHPALVDYKGLTRYRDTVVEWLRLYDDGSPTTPGTAPE
ncbi:MAG: heme-dependent oxidative N-demethylase family protein [Steroidobacterales bacterium]